MKRKYLRLLNAEVEMGMHRDQIKGLKLTMG